LNQRYGWEEKCDGVWSSEVGFFGERFKGDELEFVRSFLGRIGSLKDVDSLFM